MPLTILSEKLNAWENIFLFGRAYGLPSQEIKRRGLELLERLGLKERAKDMVKKYSGFVNSFLGEILSVKNLEILPVTREDILLSSVILYEIGLLPRDAIHLAVMRRNGISAIASMDPDFDLVGGIVRYSPLEKR